MMIQVYIWFEYNFVVFFSSS